MLIQGGKTINIINYFDKKLIISSFCGSVDFLSRYNNILQNVSFKNNSKSNNFWYKSNGNGINKTQNLFPNNSKSIDKSLFLKNELINDGKDSSQKNSASILNKKFKSHLPKEKLKKAEISSKNKVIKNNYKIKHNNVITKIDNNK